MCAKALHVRALVSERLTAAAEEIFALVERTIAEYEEELRRSKEENQRKQQLLDSLLIPQIRLHRIEEEEGAHQRKLCIKDEPQEQSVQVDSAQLLGFPVKEEDAIPDLAAITEEEPIQDEIEVPLEVWTQPWEPPAEAEVDHEQYQSQASDANQKGKYFKIIKKNSQDGCSVIVDDEISRAELKQKLKQKLCPFCGKTLKRDLWSHMLIHSGEKPFHCDMCDTGFTRRSSLTLHMDKHLAEKPLRCPTCEKGFKQRSHLKNHMKSHKPQRQKRTRSRKRRRGTFKEPENELQVLEHAESPPQQIGKKDYWEESEETRASPTDRSDSKQRDESLDRKHKRKSAFKEPKTNSTTENQARDPRRVQQRETRKRKCRKDSGQIRASQSSALTTNSSEKQQMKQDLDLEEAEVWSDNKKCRICGKVFHDLLEHMRLHAGQRPLPSQHKAPQTNEKPFKCSECDRGFRHKRNLQLHQEKHESLDEPFQPRLRLEEIFSVDLQQYFPNEDEQSFECRPSTSAQ